MGAFFSGLSGFQHVWLVMNTTKTANFHDHLRMQFAQARALGNLETLQRATISGAMGGGNGVFGGAFSNGFGNQAALWITIANYCHSMAIFFVPVFISLGILAYLANWNPGIVFISFLGFFFFAIYYLQYVFTSGQLYISTYRPFVTSLVTALILSLITTFAVLA